MITVESQRAVRSAPVLPSTTTLGPVRIAVTDRDKALAIWQDVVGLDLISEDADALHLGVGGKVLIVLELGATVPRSPIARSASITSPSTSRRGPTSRRWLVRALQRRVRISPTDHLVSEAIYLWDLDGNGIEITFETPWRGTLGDPRTASMPPPSMAARTPVASRSISTTCWPSSAPTRCCSRAWPAGTRIGHVHVHVNDLEHAMRFYRDGIGFGGLFIMRRFGMGDVGLDYTPHAIAFNIWSGPNAAQAPEGSAGLRWFDIVVPDVKTLDETSAPASPPSASPYTDTNEGLEARDPLATW